MARILVTGGAGYVGSHAVKAATAAGHDCIVYDSLLYGHREFVRWGPLIEGDIRDADTLLRTLRAHRVDAVMHFAALAYVGQSVTEPADYYDVNINGTRVLLDCMRRAEVAHIVLSSSCAVYGQPDRMPITESTEPRPINPYGYTKLVCERMIADYGRAYGITAAKLRYFNAAGADPDGEIGEDHDPETHLIPLVLDAAVGRRGPVAVFGTDYDTPDGSCIRDYIHVSDLADAHSRAIAHLVGGGDSIAVNLGTGRGISVLQLIELAGRVSGRPVPHRREPRRPGDPATLVADPTRAREVLGWSAIRSEPTQLLQDAWAWHMGRFAKAA